ncbi:LysR family transcriptional regulator [Hansschlegelia quercus]|uniref:LysR family transcriptional regulator n=1 Tax=Hansschlegelia quercus TaxID=2528245 RepID=A0A4Q9GLL9_9HYPH|nr:LysR family transcriptional regulator [Hansschlegelia quercus]TBN53604.1 LysR family transcriptional regulator [Hansschlegelia quercus]
MQTADVDIRQIRVFLAVAQCGGFSAAQDMLGLAQSTISTEVAALEARLGYVLCRRGRGGFQLTPQGEAFVLDATTLLAALSSFETNVAKRRKQGLGAVRIAIIDNLVTDPICPLIPALDRFHGHTGGRAHIALDVLGPSEIEHGVASGRIDLAIGIFAEPSPQLIYHPLYQERDVLVCGRRNALYDEADDLELFSRIRGAEKVVRSFLRLQDFFFLSDQRDSITAQVDSVEAAALLILAGHHIGFLPDHYARRWIEAGDMRILLEKSYTRTSKMTLVHRQDASKLSTLASLLIGELLRDASQTPMKRLTFAD